MENCKRCRYYWLLPLLIVVIGTALIVGTGADLRVENFFFGDDAGDRWPLGDLAPFAFAYHYGEMLGWTPALVGILILVAGFRTEAFARWRTASLFLILSLIIGPGLVVNVTLKDHWHRPRPRQVEQFGGDYHFQQPLVIGSSLGSCKSFPSGHAAMGFIYMAPYFILLSKNRRAALWWFWGGVVYGIFIGCARMAQGAHWPSDVLWSFGTVYFTCYALARLLRLDRMEGNDQSA